MGDVVTALARAVQEEGHEVEVILPKYDIINYTEVGVIPGINEYTPSCLDSMVGHCQRSQ